MKLGGLKTFYLISLQFLKMQFFKIGANVSKVIVHTTQNFPRFNFFWNLSWNNSLTLILFTIHIITVSLYLKVKKKDPVKEIEMLKHKLHGINLTTSSDRKWAFNIIVSRKYTCYIYRYKLHILHWIASRRTVKTWISKKLNILKSLFVLITP